MAATPKVEAWRCARTTKAGKKRGKGSLLIIQWGGKKKKGGGRHPIVVRKKLNRDGFFRHG